jgi:hypothetical protein
MNMAEASIPALHTPPQQPADDGFTACAISVLAAMCANVLHEGVGHGLTALLTGANSGLLTTVAWSSAFDSRLVQAGGTVANLAAGLGFWFALQRAKDASVYTRYFLLISCAFNLFTGPGYFFFSGVSDFGDWAAVISGLQPHWLWRVLLAAGGAASYYAAALIVGTGFARYLALGRPQQKRLRKLTIIAYFSPIVLMSVAALRNPLGIQLLWQSALPATAGGQSGLLWLQYCIPRGTTPERKPEYLRRNPVWIATAALLAIAYILVLGRGIVLHR